MAVTRLFPLAAFGHHVPQSLTIAGLAYSLVGYRYCGTDDDIYLRFVDMIYF